MRKNRKYCYSTFVVLLIIVLCLLIGVFKNVPLRTAIYRTFAKQSVFLIADHDTIYNFGYFGVRKLLVDRQNGTTTLLGQNSKFTHNCFVGHLIGRSGVINGDYIYVAARSYLGGRYNSKDKNYLKGEFLILRKKDLQILKRIPSDYSMIEAKIFGNYLLVTGLQGFNVYDIAKPIAPKVIYTYRTDKAEEYQGCDFFRDGNNIYFAVARFVDGISIYRISSSKVNKVADIPIRGTTSSSGVLDEGLHVFRLKIKYPYIYATLGPTKENMGSKNDKRGIIIYDVSDMNRIKREAVLVPRQFYYKKVTGDPQPSHIDTYKDKIYVNFGEKGVAQFSSPNKTANSRFLKILNIFDNKMILPICIDNKGMMYAGSFYNDDVYTYQLK